MGCLKFSYNSEKISSDYSLKVIHSKASNDYFLYGKVIRKYISDGGFGRYLTTGHERDHETISENNDGTGLDNRGARFYDSDVARFLSLDPHAVNYPSWSAYHYVLGNPLTYIDPDGKNAWKPDSEGNLIAESGDNAQTLADFQGISLSEASNQLESQGITEVKEGDRVELNNVFTQSIKNSPGDMTLTNLLGRKNKTGFVREDLYNCFGAACSGSQGNKIGSSMDDVSFDKTLGASYVPTTYDKAKFGETVLRFANFGSKYPEHAAVFYGRDNSGADYVYTKNGSAFKPEVMKLSTLLLNLKNYGTVQGINPGEFGYYNPK